MTQAETDADTPCYIAKCLCGCEALVFASVDRPDYRKDNAKEIAALIRKGYTIDRMTVAEVRNSKFGCRK